MALRNRQETPGCPGSGNLRRRTIGEIQSIDTRKLAELLRLDNLKPVYPGETGVRMLRELLGAT
ncbi:MAG: hypothetical protein WA628_15165 [Terriglobales bacterium]